MAEDAEKNKEPATWRCAACGECVYAPGAWWHPSMRPVLVAVARFCQHCGTTRMHSQVGPGLSEED